MEKWINKYRNRKLLPSILITLVALEFFYSHGKDKLDIFIIGIITGMVFGTITWIIEWRRLNEAAAGKYKQVSLTLKKKIINYLAIVGLIMVVMFVIGFILTKTGIRISEYYAFFSGLMLFVWIDYIEVLYWERKNGKTLIVDKTSFYTVEGVMQKYQLGQGIVMAVLAFITSGLVSIYMDGEIDWVLSYVLAGGFMLGGVLTYKWQRDVETKVNEKGKIRRAVLEEKAPYSDSMKSILTLGFTILALSYFISVFGHFFGLADSPDDEYFFILLATIIYMLAMWSFFNIKFRITGNSVEGVMPPFIFSIPFNMISEVKTIEKIPWYIGWGLRIWGRRIAFVSMHKKAVMIKKKKGFFRALILTTQDPDEFIKTIRESSTGI